MAEGKSPTRLPTLSPRMAEAMPFLTRTAAAFARMLEYSESDVLQILREEALRIEGRFDPSRGTKFATFLWPAVTGAVVDHVTKDTRDRNLLVAMLNALGDAGPMAMLHNEDDRPFDLFEVSEEEIGQKLSDTMTQLAGSMFLGLMETAPDPEKQLMEAQERAAMVEKTREVMAEFSESDRVLIERHAIEGESLASVLARTPPWDARPYVTGRRYYRRLERRLAEEFAEFEFGG